MILLCKDTLGCIRSLRIAKRCDQISVRKNRFVGYAVIGKPLKISRPRFAHGLSSLNFVPKRVHKNMIFAYESADLIGIPGINCLQKSENYTDRFLRFHRLGLDYCASLTH